MRDLFDDDLEMLTPGMTMMEYAEEAMNMGFYEDMLIYLHWVLLAKPARLPTR